MNVKQLLAEKGTSVYSIKPDDTLSRCIEILNEKRIGALLVLSEDDILLGIISERDLMHGAHSLKCDLFESPVQQLMTPSEKLITGRPDELIGEVMEVMTQNRIRHLPVLEDDKVVGVVSIGDVVKALFEKTLKEKEHMSQYIYGDKS